jgi:hypothetical protein
MNDPVSRHDEKNALLFLEMFPDLLKAVLNAGEGPGSPGFEELISVLREKVSVLKGGGKR